MKELKFNLRYILQRKELYIFIIGILLFCVVDIWVTTDYYRSATFVLRTAEYQTVLYNEGVSLAAVIIIGFPILSSLLLADSTWVERKSGISNLLQSRLSNKKNDWIRFILSIVVVSLLCFIGFMLQYVALRFIFGSGNQNPIWEAMPYYLLENSGWFLDHLRVVNPVLFVICISAHVSLIIGLLAGIDYSLSFFTKQRLFIYFQIIILVIASEFLLLLAHLGQYSIIKQLQPFGKFSFVQSIIFYTVLLIFGVFFIWLSHRRKDSI